MPLSADITEAANPSLLSGTPEPVPTREAFTVRQSFLLPPMLMVGRPANLNAATGNVGNDMAGGYSVAGMAWLNVAAPRPPRPMRIFPPIV